MGQTWKGQSYNQDWVPVDAFGNVTGQKDVQANAEWAQATGGQNPYTNQAGGSPWNTAAPAAPAGPNLNTGVRDKLMSEIRLDGSVDTNDPAYQQQIAANRFNADRSADRTRAAMAQRMHAQGTGASGGFDAGVGRILADQGAQEQGFEAQLMDKFRSQNLDRMGRALQLGSGLISADDERALRAALTREGYGLQERLGNADLDFRRDALGQQMGLSQAQLDQQAMLALLGA